MASVVAVLRTLASDETVGLEVAVILDAFDVRAYIVRCFPIALGSGCVGGTLAYVRFNTNWRDSVSSLSGSSYLSLRTKLIPLAMISLRKRLN